MILCYVWIDGIRAKRHKLYRLTSRNRKPKLKPKNHTAITEHRQLRGEFRWVGKLTTADRVTRTHSNGLAQQDRRTPAPNGEGPNRRGRAI